MESALVLDMDDVLKPAKSAFEEWMSKGTPIPPDIRNIVYEIGIHHRQLSVIVRKAKSYLRSKYIFVGIRNGDEKTWFHCWKVYQTTEISSEKQIMLQALSATKDSWLLQRYLLFSLDRKLIRTQDIVTVISTVAANENGRYLAWRHIKAYWSQILSLFGNGTFAMSALITNVIPNFYTEYDYREVRHRFSFAFDLSEIIARMITQSYFARIKSVSLLFLRSWSFLNKSTLAAACALWSKA